MRRHSPTRPPELPDDIALLLDRTRRGLWLILACIALFALGDLDVPRDVLGRLYTLKLSHVGLVFGVLFAVRRATTRAQALALALLTVNGTYVFIAASDVIASHLETTPLLGVVCSMAAATLMPWGPRAQAVTIAIVGTGTVWTLALSGRTLHDLADPLTGNAGALLVSGYVAYEFQRYRAERRAAEAVLAERARLEALRADVRLAASEKTGLRASLQACAETMVRHLDAAFARVWTLDGAGKVLTLEATAGIDAGMDGTHVPVGHLAIGRIAAERVPFVTNDALDDPRLGDRDWARRTRVVAFAGHPLLFEDRLLGVVALGSHHPLSDAVRDVLAGVADTLARHVAHARGEETLAWSQRRLEDEAAVSAALVRVAHEMFSLRDTPTIFDRLCALTAEVLGSDHSAALLWNPDTDVYAPVACYGFNDEERERVGANLVPREHMSALFAARHDEDVAEVRTTRTRVPLLCIALRQGKDIIGVQTAGWRTDARPFSPRRRRIAEGIARIASMALANARLVEELERASRLKSEFVSTMSHELRTPLNVILGYADMARDPAAGGVRDSYLERIVGAGRELLELIESTLEIGRIEAGRAEVQLAPVGLGAFWDKLAKSCTTLPRRAEVSLRWEPEVPDGSLVTDPRKVEIIVRNLVGNALKFTEHGHVRVRLARDGSAAILTVSDTGIGIRPEDQEAIFQMFRQADGSDSRRFGGTGLGLYIVRRFVQQLGGTVTLESAPGRGSVFTVRLPWRATASVSDAA
jgi:signal transduction histidine kinase